MSKSKRHLHRDYHTTECGKDASHILMTWTPGEETCSTCRKNGANRPPQERRMASGGSGTPPPGPGSGGGSGGGGGGGW